MMSRAHGVWVAVAGVVGVAAALRGPDANMVVRCTPRNTPARRLSRCLTNRYSAEKKNFSDPHGQNKDEEQANLKFRFAAAKRSSSSSEEKAAPPIPQRRRRPPSEEEEEEASDDDDETKLAPPKPGGNTGRRLIEYARDPNDLSSVDLEAVEDLLRRRALAKYRSRFDVSDGVAAQLLRDHGVTIDERTQLWRAGAHYYARDPRDKADLSDAQLSEICDALRERDTARRLRAFGRADDILERLRDMNVAVDDARQRWRVGKSFYSQVVSDDDDDPSGVLALDGDAEARVAALVDERYACKTRRDFAEADDILLRLMEDHSVKVDDDHLSWTLCSKRERKWRLDKLKNLKRRTRAAPPVVPLRDAPREVVDSDE